MIYVDQNLCSGCGTCIEECGQGALSMVGNTATIDQDRCTSCGRCVDACLTGAIVVMEVDPVMGDPRIAVPAQRMAPSPMQSPPPRSPARPSRLDTIERVLSRLFGIAGYALDHDLLPRKRNKTSQLLHGGAAGPRKNAGRPCRQGGAGRRAGGRTLGGGRRGNRRRIHRQDGSC